MKKQTEGLKFTYAECESFMGLPRTVINIEGKSLMISGANEVGKSRFIQMLLSGIDSKSQATEITTKGETKASTKVTIAGILGKEDVEYTIEMYYSPKNKTGRIVLTDKKGESVKTPKEILKNIVGNISFDIFKFLNESKKEKIKVLKQISGVGKEIDILDIERKKVYDNRTYLNRTVDDKEAVMNNHGLSPEEIEKYSNPVKIEPIQEELNQVSTKITNYNKVKTGTQDFKNAAEKAEQDWKSKSLEIVVLQKKIEDLQNDMVLCKQKQDLSLENAKKGEEWLSKNEEPKATEISKRLSEAMLHNENCIKVTALAEKQKELMDDKAKLLKMNMDIESIDEKKNTLISTSKLPVEGLTFSEEDIFYKGLPLEANQINTATLYDISFEIAKVLNPNLRVIFIHAASLFDKDHLMKTIKKAEEEGYQVIAERVTEEKELSISFIESEEN